MCCPARQSSPPAVEVASRTDCFLDFSSDDSTPQSGLNLVAVVLFQPGAFHFGKKPTRAQGYLGGS
jgi:hypothetical protein